MKNIQHFIRISIFLSLLIIAKAPLAHGDHDAPTPIQSAASPRVEAHSDMFEIVATYSQDAGKERMIVFLDRYATNEPIRDAKIEVEVSAVVEGKQITTKAQATPLEDGSYDLKGIDFSKANQWSFTFTVIAGADADLLAGTMELVRPDEKQDIEAKHGDVDDHSMLAHLPLGLSPKLVAIIATFLGLLGVFTIWRKRPKTKHSLPNTVKAIATMSTAVGLMILQHPSPAVAGSNHDKPTSNSRVTTSDAPKRNSDGSVFFPKPSQRELDIRTNAVQSTDVAKSFELNGKVLADPSAGGKVQTAIGGRIELEGLSLPKLGQRVRKGELLAVVKPTVAAIEKANQATAAAEAKINLELAKRRLARLEQLEGSIAQREIDAARGEVTLLEQRELITRESLRSVERLTAPVSGIIASVNVVAGQVLAPNETLFEVIDPARFYIEALAYDASVVAKLDQAAFTSISGKSVSLALIGAGRVLKEQAVPLQFRVLASQDSALFSVGQPVIVKVKSSETLKAVRINAASVVKNPSNQDIVWVHTSAEIFTPKTIRWQAIDGANIAVTQGLSDGDRVVVRSASLLNQVR